MSVGTRKSWRQTALFTIKIFKTINSFESKPFSLKLACTDIVWVTYFYKWSTWVLTAGKKRKYLLRHIVLLCIICNFLHECKFIFLISWFYNGRVIWKTHQSTLLNITVYFHDANIFQDGTALYLPSPTETLILFWRQFSVNIFCSSLMTIFNKRSCNTNILCL